MFDLRNLSGLKESKLNITMDLKINGLKTEIKRLKDQNVLLNMRLKNHPTEFCQKYNINPDSYMGKRIIFFGNHIVIKGIHPNLSGKSILEYTKREKNKYINVDKFYDVFELMIMARNQIDDKQFKIAEDIMDICQSLSMRYSDKSIKTHMSGIITMCLNHYYRYFQHFKSEKFLYELIKKDISELIHGAKIIEFKPVPAHIPDFMIEINRNLFPIEVKVDIITQANIRQIVRYVKEYNCERGYLMGTKNDHSLPENIIFVNISNLRDKHYPQE